MAKRLVSKEVTICDSCGKESPTVICRRCYQDICGDCGVYRYSVSVEKHYPIRLDSLVATTSFTLPTTEITTYVCSKCQEDYLQGLKSYMGIYNIGKVEKEG